MATAVFDPSLAAPRRKARRQLPPNPPSPAPHRWIARAALVLALVGLVLVIVLGVSNETSQELALPGGVTTFIGSLTGLVGMYLALIQVLIVARIPELERIMGQDGMLRWHRRLGPWPISLLVAHAVFITIGYAQASKTGFGHELGALLRSYPDVLAATVGLGLMVIIGIASIRAVRQRMSRESWWVLHLYMYLALALSFAHVLALGPSFAAHPVVRIVWSLVWAATAGTVLVYRIVLPLWRSLKYRLRVVEVHSEAPGVTSVICSGQHLERLAVSGGQFFAWRFLVRGLWWQAHPYSISALPRPPYLRLTVKTIGDHSAAVARLRPGTRVAIEGPYGAVTTYARTHQKVVLFAGGIGITALRSLLEDLPRQSQPIVIMRASSEDQFIFRNEVGELVRHRKGELHELVGSRAELGSTERLLHRLVPDIEERDLFVCGPPGLIEDVIEAAKALGVAPSAIHSEFYSW